MSFGLYKVDTIGSESIIGHWDPQNTTGWLTNWNKLEGTCNYHLYDFEIRTNRIVERRFACKVSLIWVILESLKYNTVRFLTLSFDIVRIEQVVLITWWYKLVHGDFFKKVIFTLVIFTLKMCLSKSKTILINMSLVTVL